MSARRTLQRVGVACAALVATTLMVPGGTASATEDAATVRVYAVTFNGLGIVRIPDGSTPYVDVSSYNPAIFDDECSAVVVADVALPEVFRCTFTYHSSFQVEERVPLCAGTSTGDGRLTVFLPDGGHLFEFSDMKVVVDEGSAHGVGTQYVNPGTGALTTGYVDFHFAGRCNVKNKNFGKALY